jgi:hypothetical protein
MCFWTGIGPIDWAKLSRFYLKSDRIQSPKRCVLVKTAMGIISRNKIVVPSMCLHKQMRGKVDILSVKFKKYLYLQHRLQLLIWQVKSSLKKLCNSNGAIESLFFFWSQALQINEVLLYIRTWPHQILLCFTLDSLCLLRDHILLCPHSSWTWWPQCLLKHWYLSIQHF